MFDLRKLYAYVVLFCVIAHIALDSNYFLILTCALISLMGAWHCSKSEIYFSDVFLFVLSVYSGLAPLLIKMLLMQSLDMNLESPYFSAALLFIGYVSLSYAGVFSRPRDGRVWSGNWYIVNSLKNPRVINLMAPFCAFFGTIFFILHVMLRPVLSGDELVQTEGFGGFGSLYFLLLLGFAMFAYSYKVLDSKKAGFYIFVLVPIVVALSVFANVKKNMFDMLWILALSYFSFGFRVDKKIVALCAVMLSLVVLYVSPVIHLMRTDFSGMGLVERGQSFFRILNDYDYDPGKLRDAEARYIEGFQYSFNPKNSYTFPSNLNLDRFFLIKTLDRVVSSDELDPGHIGVEPFARLALEGILPSFLIEKSLYVGADLVGWEYGMVHVNSIGRPVIGFYASAWAAAGFMGLIFFPWILFFPAFYFMNKFVGEFRGNVFLILMLAVASQLAEKEIDAFCVAFFRDYVFIYFGIWWMVLLAEFWIRKNPWKA